MNIKNKVITFGLGTALICSPIVVAFKYPGLCEKLIDKICKVNEGVVEVVDNYDEFWSPHRSYKGLLAFYPESEGDRK
ncbi:MAG: hypothetical protein ABIB79_05355 [archaeon]